MGRVRMTRSQLLRASAGALAGGTLAACEPLGFAGGQPQKPVARRAMTLQFTHWDDIRQRPDTYLRWYT